MKRSFTRPLSAKLRRMTIRLTNWEYWPFDIVYLPVYIYWIWLSAKARSFFFFSASNPLIKNAGFVLEQKKEIYDLLPAGSYPRTELFNAGTSSETISLLLCKKNFHYPLIAKPDIGQRGMGVRLLKTKSDLEQYTHSCKVNFLVQEFISYEQEIGIFYYRIPGAAMGHISGIVGKEFLSVTGDGSSSIKELLGNDSRHVLQLPTLQITYGDFLNKVLSKGESINLVPYGNHSRGAKFTDLTHKVTPGLSQTIDVLCQCIPEFYYGRLDIKFNNWEDLAAGRNFSIIELNGAGSEPTHIYDPSHSILFAWKEIFRHLNLLYKISRLNAERTGARMMSTRDGLRMLKENRRYLRILSSQD